MKTIKLVGLIVKLANKEELPKKIKFHNQFWELENLTLLCKDYRNLNGKNYLFNDKWYLTNNLNDEVEIIEEKQNIKKLSWQQVGYQTCEGDERKIRDVVLDFNKQIDQIGKKLNELIDIVNDLNGDE